MATSAKTTQKRRNPRTDTSARKGQQTAPASKPRKALPKKKGTTTSAKQAVSPDTISNVAAVPDKSLLEGYVNRVVVHGQSKKTSKSDFDVFDTAFEKGKNVLIEGPTGSGKTTGIQVWAAARGLRYGAIPSHAGAEHTAMFGRYIPDEDGEKAFVWVMGLVSDIVKYGGVLLINEVNFLPERISTVLFSLLDFRREIVLQDHKNEVLRAHRPTVTKRKGNEVVEIPCWCDDPGGKECRSKWVIVFADFNPEYEGTRPLNKAFRNRFQMQLTFDYDPDIEQQLVRSASMLEMATKLRNDESYETPVATNMLVDFEADVIDLGIDFAVMNFVNHFALDERDAVKLVVNAYEDNIAQEVLDEGDDEEEEVDDDDVIEVDEDTLDWVYASN